MGISLILQINKDNYSNLEACLNEIKLQSFDFDKFELLAVCNTDNLSENNIIELKAFCVKNNISYMEDVEIDRLKGKYVCFYDLNYRIPPSTFDVLYKEMKQHNVDFVVAQEKNLTDFKFGNHTDVFKGNLHAVKSFKLIETSLLKKIDIDLIKYLNNRTICFLNFYLYLNKNYKYKIVNVKYRNNFKISKDYIESIIKEIDYLHSDILTADLYADNVRLLLIKECMHLIDKNTFLDLVDERSQITLFKILNQLLSKINNTVLKNSRLSGYSPFFNLLKIEAYDEAVKYMKLLRSRRYWYDRTQKYEVFFKRNPSDISDSLSWKITKPLRFLKQMFDSIYETLFAMLVWFLAFCIKVKHLNKPIWLIGERADQAEDNGYHFYKYCRENFPQQKVYYVINQDSPHVERVTTYKNVIFHSSIWHWSYMLAADVYISAWIFEETSYPIEKEKFVRLFGDYVKNKCNISIQHGVIIQNISPYLHKSKYNLDLIIASSNQEKKIIQNTLGYANDEIAVTGLARFDNLHENKHNKKQVLIMPTWRRSLANISPNSFIQTDYYKAYKGILENPKFLKIIEENDLSIKFYIHNQMQKYMENFKIDNPKIEF
ncbi:MAG: CDP-glycerol glycerophosphotransferase family protein, partial [Bacilli bacterium]